MDSLRGLSAVTITVSAPSAGVGTTATVEAVVSAAGTISNLHIVMLVLVIPLTQQYQLVILHLTIVATSSLMKLLQDLLLV